MGHRAARHRPTIRIDRGERRWLVWATGAVVLLLTVAVVVLAVQLHAARRGPAQGDDPAARLHALQTEVSALRAENETLQRELAMARRGSAVDETASRELLASLAGKERELAALREELSFYKSMVDSDQAPAQGGLEIRDLRVTPGDGPHRYRYRLVLTSMARKKHTLRGRIELRVQGRRNGEREVLAGAALAGDGKASPPRYRFQYFQRLAGEFVLPDGFEPENVLVRVVPRGKRDAAVQQSFSWNSVTKGG